METNYTYDIAISCAGEDIEVAEKIAAAFKSAGINYYLYTEHHASNLGANILKLSFDQYGGSLSRYVLVLISKCYINKYWTDMERQIAQTVNRPDGIYMIPIQLGPEMLKLNGFENIIGYKWDGDVHQLALLIKEKINDLKKRKAIVPENKGNNSTSIRITNTGSGTVTVAEQIGVININQYRK